ncbi:MAG TPA: GlsB/YeaQ/YmgE family stress response membrane protein [Egibacteraceae bacterium]|nr:GlsB/YeaQ/YmgE family stress response membrane protein [Egibacteraceae bacterium]
MLGLLLSLLVIGIIAGFLARLIVPGRDPMSFWETVALGVVGSFVGGFLGALLFRGELELGATGILGSIIGAVIALLIYRSVRRPHHA